MDIFLHFSIAFYLNFTNLDAVVNRLFLQWRAKLLIVFDMEKLFNVFSIYLSDKLPLHSVRVVFFV